ncbi:MAG: hypothetical protein VX438_06510, partial [Planctomycetota bacterium]|nr:hypothetical protein [Planctomycetota bacterium]
GSYRRERNGGLRNGKGSLLEGGIRTPGIVYWPKRIQGGKVEQTPAGSIDILPTICGLVGIEKPKGVSLDGADLTPILTRENSRFKRLKPMTWHSPTSQPVMAIRDGDFSLVGYRKKEYPKDQAAIRTVMEGMRVILEEKQGRKLTAAELWDHGWNSPLKTPEWKRLRSKFVMLNTFQEAWIPLIKSGSGGISRFELYDLSTDPGQKKNIISQLPAVADRLKKTVLAINATVLREAPVWGSAKLEPSGNASQKMRIHRLASRNRSRFDAFAYLNRIPVDPEVDETQNDLAGRILGRLANQEGRVLVKLPPGMNRSGYEGFKVALRNEEALHAGRCFTCHHLPSFGNSKSQPPVPSLRNLTVSNKRLAEVLKNKTHRGVQLDSNDVNRLIALLQILTDVPDDEFRGLIINSNVLDTTGGKE